MVNPKYFTATYYKGWGVYWRSRLGTRTAKALQTAGTWLAKKLQMAATQVLNYTDPPKEPIRVETGSFARTVIILVGTGGTGSYCARYLAQLVYTLQSTGQDIRLIMIDPDQVEEKNVGRQDFCLAEIGLDKAATLAQRYRIAYGISVTAVVSKFEADMLERFRPAPSPSGTLTIVVGAVDNWQARRDMAEAIETELNRRGPNPLDRIWWVDSGNERDYGQVYVGNSLSPVPLISPFGFAFALPLPHLQDRTLVIKPEKPRELDLSCADMALLEEQNAMINKIMATWLMYPVYKLLWNDLHIMSTYVNLRKSMGRAISTAIEGGRYVRPSSSAPTNTPTPLPLPLAVATTAPPPAEPPAEIDPNTAQCPNCGLQLTRGQTTLDGVMLEVLFCECGHQEIGCPQCMGAVHRDDNTAPPRIVCDECQWSQQIPEAFRQETVTLTEVIINGLREEVEL